MKSTGLAARVYQDFEPSMEWVPEDDSDTLLVYLIPGFAKEQLRVQPRERNVIISGERKLQLNTWSRFRVEFPVSANCDLNKVSAKFEGNILFVRQPKLTPAPKPEQRPAGPQPAVPLPTPQTPPVDDDDQVPETKPNLENKQERKDQAEVIPNMGLEETSQKLAQGKDADHQSKTGQGVNQNAPVDKKTSNDDSRDKNDKTTKTALDNYKRAVGVFAAKLKTSRNAVNTILILLAGLVIGMYVSNSFKS